MSNYIETVDDLPSLAREIRRQAPAKVEKANWAAIGSLMLGVFGLVTAEFLPISLLTPMAADLGVSVSAAGQAITATAIIGGIAALVTAIVTRNVDRRIVIWVLMGSLIASSLIAATATSYAALLAARVLLGIGLGGFWSMVGALALRLVPAESAPRALSIIFAGVSAATISGAPLGAYIGDVWGWRVAFYLAAIIGAITLAVQVFAMPRLAPDSAPSFKSMGNLMTRPQIIIGFIILLLMISGHFAGLTYIRPFLEQVPQIGVRAISLTLLAFGLAGFLGTLIAGQILARSVRADLAIGALGIAAAMAVLFAFGHLPLVAAAAATFWGVAFGLVPVGFQTWAVKAAPNDTEAIGGLIVAAFQVAITAGAALGGVIVASYGATGAIFYAMVATLIGGLMIVGYRGFAKAG